MGDEQKCPHCGGGNVKDAVCADCGSSVPQAPAEGAEETSATEAPAEDGEEKSEG